MHSNHINNYSPIFETLNWHNHYVQQHHLKSNVTVPQIPAAP